MRTGMMAGAVLVALGAAHPARTAPTTITVTMHCPDLSDEELAHVEAMVRADLLARVSRVTGVTFECQATWVTAEFYFDGGSVSRGQPKASSASLIAEQLILLPDGVRLEELGGTGDAGAVMFDPSVPARRVVSPSASSSDTLSPPVILDPSLAPVARMPATFDTSTPASEHTPASARFDSTNALTSTVVTRTPRATSSQWIRSSVSLSGTVVPRRAAHWVQDAMRFEAFAGLGLEPMLKNTDGMLGPVAGFGAELEERFVLRMTTTMLWAMDAPDDYVVRDHRIALGFEYRDHNHLAMGMSALLTALRVSAPTGATQAYRWSPIEPGCELHIGYRWQLGSFAFELRPTLTLYGHARVVRRDLERVLEVPLLLGGIVAQTSFTF